MVDQIFRGSAAVFAMTAAVACTCELTLGPGASDAPSPPTTIAMQPMPAPTVVTQNASAIDPGLKSKPLAPEPTGTLSEASVRKTAGRHHNEVGFCIEQDGTPTAKMRVGFLVMPDGSVHSDIEVLERSDLSQKLESCMISSLKRWKFEAPKGGPARATLTMQR
jgi:hypothetical protein